MKILELRQASKPLADYAADLGSDSLVITSNNKPVASLVSEGCGSGVSCSWLESRVRNNHPPRPSGSQEREGIFSQASLMSGRGRARRRSRLGGADNL